MGHQSDRMTVKERPGVVYSTELGEVCPDCGEQKKLCRCAGLRAKKLLGDGDVRVRRERQGRGGKTVTTVSGVPYALDQLKSLASELKRRCGTGGTVKDGVIEIQGDCVDLLLEELKKRGLKAKRSGG